jgi:hypothetical protein
LPELLARTRCKTHHRHHYDQPHAMILNEGRSNGYSA